MDDVPDRPDQTRPTERQFGEGLATDGPNDQSSTPMRVARPTDPGATPGVAAAAVPRGAEEVSDRARGAPRLGEDAVAAAEPGDGEEAID